MHKKINSALGVVIIIIVAGTLAILIYFGNDRQKQSSQIQSTTQAPSVATTNQPFSECVNCVDGETWNDKSCCTADFEKNCLAKNGVIRWSDLHPIFPSSLLGCFQKAADTGKNCASGSDCISGICDLKSAVESGKCSLVKKELTGEKNKFNNEEFYNATYSCSTANPGKCTEAIENRTNPGGASHYFKMNGNILTEVKESGPIF